MLTVNTQMLTNQSLSQPKEKKSPIDEMKRFSFNLPFYTSIKNHVTRANHMHISQTNIPEDINHRTRTLVCKNGREMERGKTGREHFLTYMDGNKITFI